MPDIDLPQGRLHYRDEGSGPSIVLIHGLLVDGRLWDDVVPRLAEHARVIVPDLPLGSHRTPMRPDADLTPYGLARLIADFLERLELTDVTLVGNDTGGGLCQIVVTRHPERVGRLVLTPCDAFDNFPPKMFRPLQYLGGYVPGALALVGQAMRSRTLAKSQLGFGPLVLDHRPDLYVSWLAPARDAKIRRDLRKVLRGIRPRYTLEAAEKLSAFGKPGGRALIIWADRDRFFPHEHAERLAKLLDARLETIGPSSTFVSLDQPERLAELVAGFIPRRQEQAARGAEGAAAPG